MGDLRKTLKTVFVVVAMAWLIAATIYGAIYVSNIDNRRAAEAFPPCSGIHTEHKVVIEDGKVVPSHIDAKRCDTLTITNLDNKERYMAFGEHDRHVTYDGVSERYLSKKGSFTVKLVQTGDFRFHDHIEENVYGTFSVR